MENIKFNVDKLITMVYSPGAGGRTLINALGLSPSCFFTNYNFIKLQLKEKFNSEEKFIYLKTKLLEFKKTNIWDDLGLRYGMNQYWDLIMRNKDHRANYFLFKSAHKIPYELGPFYFISGGFPIHREEYQTFIVFYNENKIISLRKQKFLDINESDLGKINDDIKQALIKHNKKEIIDYDADNLNDTDKFTESVLELMKHFNMEIPNIDYIKEYHKLWYELNF